MLQRPTAKVERMGVSRRRQPADFNRRVVDDLAELLKQGRNVFIRQSANVERGFGFGGDDIAAPQECLWFRLLASEDIVTSN